MRSRSLAIVAAIAGAVGGLVGAAVAAATSSATRWQLGNLAEWVSAVGTLGAFGAALLLFRHEVGIRRQEETDRAEAKARGVILDVAPGMGTADVTVAAINDTDRPVFDVEISAGTTTAGTYTQLASSGVSQGALNPGDRFTWILGGQPLDWIAVTYTDESGRTWRRDNSGNLSRVQFGRVSMKVDAQISARGTASSGGKASTS